MVLILYTFGGVSPVFYIGQSKNLWKRIEEYIRYTTKQAMEEHDEYFWWPRYQYAAAYGLSVAWYFTRGKLNSNVLEAELIEHFYEMYGSIPIANDTWPTGLRDPHEKWESDDDINVFDSLQLLSEITAWRIVLGEGDQGFMVFFAAGESQSSM